MSESNPPIIRFNGGQVSEKVRARSDLEDYDAMLEKCDGFIPIKYGEAQAMTGFLHGETTKFASKTSILIAFQYSATDSFWLELGDSYMRVVIPLTGKYVIKTSADAWTTPTAYVIGDYVTESTIIYFCKEAHTSGTFATDLAADKWVAQTIFEIPTPFTEAQLYDIQPQNLNDLVVLTHGSHFVQEVNRLADDDWTIGDYALRFPPFLSENKDPLHFMTSAALTGSGVNITASGTGNAPFVSGMIGGQISLTHTRSASETVNTIAGSPGNFTPPVIKVKGDWSFKSDYFDPSDVGTDDVFLERSDDGGSTYVEIFRTTNFPEYAGFDISGTEEEDGILFRYTCDGITANDVSGAVNITFRTPIVDIAGYATITGITSPTIAVATIEIDFESTVRTHNWREGGWSDHQGYPKASTTFEQRMYFGGTTRKPTAVWASATDDIASFDFRNADDDDAFFRVIDNSQNSIQWMGRKDKVLIGTAGEEFYLSSSNEAEAITPSNVTSKTLGGNGSAQIKPVSLGSSLAFVTLNGVQLRELIFEGQGYNSDSDLTELADSITGTGIKQLAYQQYPNRIIYAIRNDGVLLGIVFDKKNQVKAWFTRHTDGEFESIVSTRSGAGVNDPLGVVVKMDLDGVETRFIRTLAEPTDTNTDWVYLDGSIRSTTLSLTQTGLDHLEGKTVKVMMDGATHPNKVVASGQITLDKLPKVGCVIGLDFDNEVITLPIRQNGSFNSKPKKKSISSVLLGVRKSLGGEYGYKGVDDKGDPISVTDIIHAMDTGDRIMDTALDPVTRYYDLPVEGGNYNEISLVFRRSNPTPLNVTHAIPTLETSPNS